MDDVLGYRGGDQLESPGRPFNRYDPSGALRVAKGKCQDSRMRVNIVTQSSGRWEPGAGTIPVSLTIRPACGLQGDYQYETDSAALLKLLRRETDLPATALERFEEDLYAFFVARLRAVELSERVLTEIGYFTDFGHSAEKVN